MRFWGLVCLIFITVNAQEKQEKELSWKLKQKSKAIRNYGFLQRGYILGHGIRTL